MTTATASLPHFVRWGGVLETIYTEFKELDIPKKIKKLAKKISLLESTKTIEEIHYCLQFTKEEVNYLNSPLLDELFETIFSKNPVKTAIKADKFLVFLFYAERMVEKQEFFWINTAENSRSLKVLKYFLENRKINDLGKRIISLLRGDPLYDAVTLLYLEFIPKITENFVSTLDYSEMCISEEINEKILERIKDVKVAEKLLLTTLRYEEWKEIAYISKKIIEKFPHLSFDAVIQDIDFLMDDDDPCLLFLRKKKEEQMKV